MVLPIRLAFLEWSRKSELSADRAELLGSQDLAASMRLFMKMAGGANTANVRPGDLNLEPFMQQANEYATQNDGLDVVYKVLNTLVLTHPMNVVRAGEVQKLGAVRAPTSGSSAANMSGAAARPTIGRCAMTCAKRPRTIKREFSEFADQVKTAAKRATDRARDAFNDARSKGAV